MNQSGPRASTTGVHLSLLFTGLLTGLLSGGLLSSCGGGSTSSGGGNGGDMFIDTCSLGCGNGAGGSQVSCSIVNIAVDREIDVFFSDAIDPASVNSSTFQLIDASTGQAPVGSRFVDSTDPRKMIFRPAITFDSQGNVTFGFSPLRTYLITIAGTSHHDSGPFVRSLSGQNNQSRMDCQIHTTNQVDDLVAGPPIASVWVSLATGQPPPNDHLDNQAAGGAANVWHNSTIRFSFNDVMNPVSLVNPLTHQATLITILVDSDGDPATTNDQVPLFGNYALSIDLQHLTTDLLFTPANGIPSAGEDSLPPPAGHNRPRFLIIDIPPGVQDLAGNGVSNPGAVICTPELIQYSPLALPDADGENFTSTSNEDTQESGADWGSGRLAAGWGGGSGRLGALHVPALQTLTLDTSGTLFKNLSAPDPVTSMPIVGTTGILDNSQPTLLPPAGYNPTDLVTWPTATVIDGTFEFSSIFIENGAILKFVGTRHVRLFSRGPVTINGVIDLRGESCAAQLSDSAAGGVKGGGGPNGGDGGNGADRPDTTDLDLQVAGGISNPGAIIRGGRGLGVGRVGSLASGRGGINCPDPMPSGTLPNEPSRGGMLYSGISGSDTDVCTVRQVASPGGGGGYGVSGGSAVPSMPTPQAFNPNYPPPPLYVSNAPSIIAAGGDSTALGIEPPDPQSGHVIRLLDAQRNLRGGSGGGGGGANVYNSYSGALTGPDGHDCYHDTQFGLIEYYTDHSAAAGGGGGGAIQIASGVLIHVGGSIVAAGGDGGNSVNDPLNDRASRAAPGGGGSGGAVRLQARSLTIDPTPEHVDVSGGLGGVNLSPSDSGGVTTLGHAGDGGSGLIRLEDLSGGTSPPATLMTRCSEAPKVLPYLGPDHPDPNTLTGPCVGETESEALLSVGPWSLPTRRPETFSSSVSCWMRPTGSFFTLNFAADDLSVTPPVYGWNMNVVYHNASGADVITTYRGRDANTPFSSGDFETNFGSAVNYLNALNPPGNQFGTGIVDPTPGGTYMTVRFQGALAVSDISGDPCDVTLSGTGSKIAGGSLTPWVRHPSELNLFQPRPNMIRFCVVFDRSLAVPGTIPANVRGVTGLIVNAQPD